MDHALRVSHDADPVEAYRDELAAFVAMIETGVAPLATLTDGLEAQRLVETAMSGRA